MKNRPRPPKHINPFLFWFWIGGFLREKNWDLHMAISAPDWGADRLVAPKCTISHNMYLFIYMYIYIFLHSLHLCKTQNLTMFKAIWLTLRSPKKLKVNTDWCSLAMRHAHLPKECGGHSKRRTFHSAMYIFHLARRSPYGLAKIYPQYRPPLPQTKTHCLFLDLHNKLLIPQTPGESCRYSQKVNPRATVPTIRHDGKLVLESVIHRPINYCSYFELIVFYVCSNSAWINYIYVCTHIYIVDPGWVCGGCISSIRASLVAQRATWESCCASLPWRRGPSAVSVLPVSHPDRCLGAGGSQEGAHHQSESPGRPHWSSVQGPAGGARTLFLGAKIVTGNYYITFLKCCFIILMIWLYFFFFFFYVDTIFFYM